MPYSALRQELDRMASRIWDDLTVVRASRGPVRLGEVTVTERLHLDLVHSGLLTGLVVYDVPDEPTTGADWEWFVQTPPAGGGAPRFVHYRIQAKILKSIGVSKAPVLRFDHINHGGGSQRATLLNSAQQIGAIPYYAFYVGNPWPQSAPIALPPWRTGAVPREHFGCTAVPAAAVNDIYNRAVTKSEANQYLSGFPNTPVRQGRRLSDLFHFPSGSPTTGGAGPSGVGPQGAPPLDGRAKELTSDQAAMLDEIRSGTVSGEPPVLLRESRDGEREVRMTAFFTV